MRVQAFVAKATVERFYEGIVRRFARSTEVQRHAILVRPAVECFRDESGPLSTRVVLGAATNIARMWFHRLPVPRERVSSNA